MKKPKAGARDVAGAEPAVDAPAGGDDGAMLIRLGRVRPAGTGVVPAESPAVPAERRRTPLPARPTRALKLVERNASLDRLMEASRPRVPPVLISFIIAVLLPTILTGLYYAYIASPQYVSEFRFSVRTEDSVGLSQAAGSQSALITTMVDNFLIADFVKSRDAVDGLEERVGLRALYAREDIDWLSRFKKDGSAEDLVAYWDDRVSAHFDMTTGINTVEVRAFSPDDAHRVASTLKELCEKLVNGLSDKARQSQLAFAEEQLQRSENKLQELSQKETAFRNRVQSVDAAKSADAKIALATKLRGDLTGMRAELDTLSGYLDEQSPRIRVLKSELASSERQLAELEGSVSGTGVDIRTGLATTSQALAEYEDIKLQKEFATKIYESTLQAYEHARMRAASNTLYLATYVEPSLPDDPLYPRRILDTFLAFLIFSGVWVVGSLVFYSIRDHAG